MNPKIIVVGSSNTDMVVQTSRLPMPGETVLGGDLVIAPGGKGANQAVAAARLGAPVTFIARIGKDLFGEEALRNFKAEGLDTRFVIQDSKAPSGVALIVVGPDGENIITVAPGANSRLTPSDVKKAGEVFQEASVVLIQLETPLETVMRAARIGRKHGCRIILNPAPAPSEPLPRSLYRLLDLITPNETEATRLTGLDDPVQAAASLLDRGVPTVIITLGEEGALVATKNSRSVQEFKDVPGFSVKAVDATAAGDAFNGALAVALSQGQDLGKAVRFAHGAAALSVIKLGAQPSLPTLKEVLRFIATNEANTFEG